MKVIITIIGVTGALGLVAHKKYALSVLLAFLLMCLSVYAVYHHKPWDTMWNYSAMVSIGAVFISLIIWLSHKANMERRADEKFSNDEKLRVREAEEREVRKTKDHEQYLKLKDEAYDVLNEKRKEWNDGQLAHQECILMKKDVFTVRIRKGGTKFYMELLENQTLLYKEKL